MRSKLIKSVLLAVCCIVIYSVIYNYTTQINSINKNNTYESDAVYKNYRIDYINKYVETIKTNNYQGGFNMLDDDAKKYFNDNLVQYSEYIINLTRGMNKTNDGLKINLVDEVYMKKYNIIEYELISKDYEYIENNEVYFSGEHTIFKQFKLIELSPNVFQIYIR